MKKKAYLIPATTVMVMETRQIMVVSGGGEDPTDPQVSNDTDDTNPEEDVNDNRSRKTYNCWDDEEEEDW